MARHNKQERITVRLTKEQMRRLSRAAALETLRRGETIDPSRLMRELIIPQLDEILASEEAKASVA